LFSVHEDNERIIPPNRVTCGTETRYQYAYESRVKECLTLKDYKNADCGNFKDQKNELNVRRICTLSVSLIRFVQSFFKSLTIAD